MVLSQEPGLFAEPVRRSHKVKVDLDHTRGLMIDIARHCRGLNLAVMEIASAGKREPHAEYNLNNNRRQTDLS